MSGMIDESIRDYVKEQNKRLEAGSEAEAFEYVANQAVLTQYDLDDNEIERGHVGGGNDGGYDGIYIFINERLINGESPESVEIEKNSKVEIHFIQAKYQTHFREVCIQNWKDSFKNLISDGNPDRERYNSQVIECFLLIRSLLNKTISQKLSVEITFWGISLVESVSSNVKKQADELKLLVEETIPPKNTEVKVEIPTDRDFSKLLDQTPDTTFKLTGTKDPLFPDSKSAILTVRLGDFFTFITDANGNLNKSLFEDNIRDYQGGVYVNKAIKETLQSEDSIDFWWLNNGITILADEMSRGMDSAVELKNPRIVNGLQTSNELWRHFHNVENKDDSRKVLIKCIATDDQDARARIIRATNSQTSIPSAYLHSLDVIQLHIEQYFKRHGLHYDRRKNSCKNAGVPAKEIVSVPFLGQCLIATLLSQPDYARARPAQILNDQNKYDAIFNENNPLEAYSALARLALAATQYLKRSSQLDRGAQNDLLFYVVYIASAKQADSFKIKPNDLKSLKVPSKEDFDEITRKIYEVYQRNGANSQIAKNSDFTKQIETSFSEIGAN